VTTDDRPIGIFDSGVGGLTVAQEVIRQLPDEHIIYFGDTARVPYGPKSPETVRRYSREISAFLVGEGVKCIVVACNTATAHALDALREAFAIPIIGVVDPGARAGVAATSSGRVGVIGTVGTITSGAYERAIVAIDPTVSLTTQACPLFVPLVEEDWVAHAAARLVAEEYLAPFGPAAIDTLVLGCTHYPLLKPLLADILGPAVRLIDSAAETAAEMARVLRTRGMLHEATPAGGPPMHRFVASDDPRQVLRLGTRFLGQAIDRVEVRTLG